MVPGVFYPRTAWTATGLAALSLGYLAATIATYGLPRGHISLLVLLPVISVFSGSFAPFTMYLPAILSTLLRTVGAEFC
jgi:hypothetical protein